MVDLPHVEEVPGAEEAQHDLTEDSLLKKDVGGPGSVVLPGQIAETGDA